MSIVLAVLVFLFIGSFSGCNVPFAALRSGRIRNSASAQLPLRIFGPGYRSWWSAPRPPTSSLSADQWLADPWPDCGQPPGPGCWAQTTGPGGALLALRLFRGAGSPGQAPGPLLVGPGSDHGCRPSGPGCWAQVAGPGGAILALQLISGGRKLTRSSS